MKAPNSTVLGIAVVLISVSLGVVVMSREPDAPAPKDRQAASPAAIERQLREGEVLAGTDDTPFRLRHPDEWVEIEKHQLPKADPSPVAGLRRTNNAALLAVSVDGPVEGGLDRLERETRRRGDSDDEDLRLRAVRRVRVAAGPALYASYTRRSSKQIQTALIVPDGDRSYRVDAVVRSEARDAAAQLGAMLRTFDVAGV